MKKHKKKILINSVKIATVLVCTALMFMLGKCLTVYAAPSEVSMPSVNISLNEGAEGSGNYVTGIKVIIFFTVLTLIPSIIITITSFTRIAVVFSFLKTAIGVQSIPAQILNGLAIFLTLFIMYPTFNEINTNALKPYMADQITNEQAMDEIAKPIKQFMAKETRKEDIDLFVNLNNVNKEEITEINDIPLTSMVPAFMISELKTAFEIGFCIYLPFIVIDMVVASVLMSMGMMMVPPTSVAIPFKLILFVMVDGWNLLVESLVKGFM